MKVRIIIFFSLAFIGLDCYSFGHVPRETGACEVGFFPCGNSSQCLAQALWCDEKPDCDNQKDEDFEVCYYQGGMLQTFFENHQPINSNWNDSNSPTDIIDKCNLSDEVPSGCSCLAGDRLRCQGLGLTDLPADLPSQISVGYLCENGISEIPNDTFKGLNSLTKLYLTKNRLTLLAAGMFSGLTSLTTLDMEGNLIAQAEGSVLTSLSLVTLCLGNNRLNLYRYERLDVPSTVIALHLQGNPIRKVTNDMFLSTQGVLDLSLQRCGITYLEEDAFYSLIYLRTLDISENKLIFLSEKVFSRNTQLQELYIGNNPMTILPLGLFRGLGKLEKLVLTGLEITNIDKSMFSQLTRLSFIYFKRFRQCHYAITVRMCSPKSDGLSSIENLLESPILRICIWVVAVVTIVANIVVLVSRSIIKGQHKVHTMFLMNLAASDSLMGIYLLIIAMKDVYLENRFNMYALTWMESSLCRCTGGLAMLSYLVSLLILVCITFERFLSIVFPLRPASLSHSCAWAWLFLIWGCGVVLSVAPVLFIDTAGNNFYGSNAVCFPLHLREPYAPGWKYSALNFLGLNLVAFCLIAVMYIAMCRSIVKTRRNAHNGIKIDYAVVQRFTAIILTNALCWIPIAIIKLLALNFVTISDDTDAWLTVIILPINSALNPIIYTLTTPWFFDKLKSTSRGYNWMQLCTMRVNSHIVNVNTRSVNLVMHNCTLQRNDSSNVTYV